MTPVQLASYVRLKTRTNSTTLTNADLLTLANVVKDRLAIEAIEADEDLFLMPTLVDLVANQREYPFPTDILSRIKRVEAKLDGSNWIYLREKDITDMGDPIASESDITSIFSNEEGNAFFDIMRSSLWIYSGTITNVTDGLKIWVNRWVADLTSMESTTDMSIDPTNTTHGIPRALHMVMAKGMIIEWKESREKPIALSQTEIGYEAEVRKAVARLKRGNLDRETQGSIPYDDGSEY